ESLAMRKPLLLGVDGEARQHFIEKGKAGMYFAPENENELAKCVLFLAENREELRNMGENARTYVSDHFNRNRIANSFHEKLKQLNSNS
ncbi:MAG: glycosyltransferase, partial [Bacteroidota bacterium]